MQAVIFTYNIRGVILKVDLKLYNTLTKTKEIFKPIDENEVRIVKPADVDGCVFVMLEQINPYITDVFNQDIVRKFLDMNYMLVCINEFPSNDLEKYKTIIEETIRFFHICEKPFFYMGCEVNSIFEILEIN